MAGGTGRSGRFHSNACNAPRHSHRVERSAGLRSWVRGCDGGRRQLLSEKSGNRSEMVCHSRKSEQPDCHRPPAWHGASHRCALRRASERWIDLRDQQLETYWSAQQARTDSAAKRITPRRQTTWRRVRFSIGKQRPFPAGSMVAHSSRRFFLPQTAGRDQCGRSGRAN